MFVDKLGAKFVCALDDDKVLQVTTTKVGGFSSGSYASFNAALHVGDNHFSVLKNIEKLKTAWGINRLVCLNQVHGADILEVSSENISDVAYSDGDGLFTKESGIALGILTADCWNVHLIGKKCIASLHCGWRSFAGGIVESAFAMFLQAGDEVEKAVIGPGISARNYEVGAELVEKFSLIGFAENIEYTDKKACFSIGGAIEKVLTLAGVKNIVKVGSCTFDSDYFFSNRRDNGKTGRMLSVLMRK